MCYSAQIWGRLQEVHRQFGAILSVGEFTRIFWERREGASPIPKAIELAFAEPRDEFKAHVKQMIEEARDAELARIDERISIQQGRSPRLRLPCRSG